MRVSTYFELLFATLCWGFGFIASIWALQGTGPFLNCVLRFGIAVVFLDLIFRLRLFKNLQPIDYKFKEFLSLFLPGFLLFVTMITQTWALKYTTATRCGFITALYVLFIPIFERIFMKTRIKPLLACWIFLALVGTALICQVLTSSGLQPGFLGAINKGDWLTLVCAIFIGAHVITVNQTMHKVSSSATYHIYQCIWITLLSVILVCFTEGFGALAHFAEWDLKIWAGLIHLGIFSTAIGFLIQIRAQKTIPPTTFGLLVLLESPWALMFSVAIGLETVSGFQLMGAGFILLSAVLESLSAYHSRKVST
jgi:drug/metabolite transporter (DMT)-like permease